MSSRYDEISKSLRGRWKPSWSGNSFSQLRTALDESLNAVAKLCSDAANLRSLGPALTPAKSSIIHVFTCTRCGNVSEVVTARMTPKG